MMKKYYDIAFHVLNDRVLVKKQVSSDKEVYDAWKDACAKIDDDFLYLFVDDQYITLTRSYIVRIDVREVSNPIDKEMRRKETASAVVQKISDMGF